MPPAKPSPATAQPASDTAPEPQTIIAKPAKPLTPTIAMPATSRAQRRFAVADLLAPRLDALELGDEHQEQDREVDRAPDADGPHVHAHPSTP